MMRVGRTDTTGRHLTSVNNRSGKANRPVKDIKIMSWAVPEREKLFEQGR